MQPPTCIGYLKLLSAASTVLDPFTPTPEASESCCRLGMCLDQLSSGTVELAQLRLRITDGKSCVQQPIHYTKTSDFFGGMASFLVSSGETDRCSSPCMSPEYSHNLKSVKVSRFM